MIEIRKSTSQNEAADMAREASRAGLYVVGWTLQQIYAKLVRGMEDDVDLYIAYEDGKPIACLAVDTFCESVEIFVKPSFRRRGIGTALVAEAKKNTSDLYGHYRGARNGSEEFFRKNGLLD